MSELDDLYQAEIMRHSREPLNYGKVEHATHAAEAYNPLCGDRISISLAVGEGEVQDVRFEAMGCAISRAAASLMTTLLKEKSPEEVVRLCEDIEGLLRGCDPPAGDFVALAPLLGVRRFPSRIKCATLGCKAVLSALQDEESGP